MRKTFNYIAAVAFLLTVSCVNHPDKSNKNSSSPSQVADTLVLSKNVIENIAGSTFLKKAIAYFVVAGPDTSDFQVVFSKEKENGSIGISIKYDQMNRKGKSFDQRMKELKLILPEAETAFNFDSLQNISIGRLVSTGDLAIRISKQYAEKFGNNFATDDYGVISNFLLESALAEEFDLLFKPYHRVVSHISIEKVFFTSKKELFLASLIEADTTQIPGKILDCITWLGLERLD